METVNKQSFLVLVLLIFFNTAYAEGMNVKTGLWEMKNVVTLPMGNGIQESSTQECIDKASIRPKDMMQDAQGCKVLNANVEKDNMDWTISCNNSGVEMIGKGHAKSGGTTVKGGMNISATFNGQTMEMSTTWEGKHIGDCK